MKIRSLLPPRKRDWRSGTHQVGVFIRYPDGKTIEAVSDHATGAMADTANGLLTLIAKGKP